MGGRAMSMLRGLALGAAAMYLLDPDKGARRRALLRDRGRRAMRESGDVLRAARNDVAGRWQGMKAGARGRRPGAGPAPDDTRIGARVRTKLGRLSAHSHAITVDVHDGRVTLGGPILAHEVDRLVTEVRAVPGVRGVDSQFTVHARADHVSSLQGGRRAGRADARSAWPPAWRVGAIAGSALLALDGLRRGGLRGVALLAGAAAIAARGVANRPLGRVLALPQPQGAASDTETERDERSRAARPETTRADRPSVPSPG